MGKAGRGAGDRAALATCRVSVRLIEPVSIVSTAAGSARATVVSWLEEELENIGSEKRETSALHPAANPDRRAREATLDRRAARRFRLLRAHIRKLTDSELQRRD